MGCDSRKYMFKNDFILFNNKCEEVVNALRNNEKSVVKEMFSVNTQNKSDIDSEINRIYDFIEGDYINHEIIGRSSSGYSYIESLAYLKVDGAIVYTTTKGIYSICLQIYFLNEPDEKEVGVRSFLVRKIKSVDFRSLIFLHTVEDMNEDFYQGVFVEDETYTKPEKCKVNSIVEALNNKNSEEIIALFSNNAKSSVSNLQHMFNYIDGTINSFDGDFYYFDLGIDDERDSKYVRTTSVYVLNTNNSKYYLGIQTIVVDSDYKDDVGINTIFITKIKEELYEENLFDILIIEYNIPLMFGLDGRKWDNGSYIY